MLNAENAQVKPNILTLTAEEEELQRRKREKGAGLMRDRTNRHRNQARNQRRSQNTELSKFHPSKEYNQVDLNFGQFMEGEKENIKIERYRSAGQNVLINFESDQEEEVREEEKQEVIEECEQEVKEETEEEKGGKIPEKQFLIALSSDEQEEQSQIPKVGDIIEEQEVIQEKEENVTPSTDDASYPERGFSNRNVLFDISFDHDEESEVIKEKAIFDMSEQQQNSREKEADDESQEESEEQNEKVQKNRSRTSIPLAKMINQFKDVYYLQPIPKEKIFQCVVKRQRTESYTRYYLYDSLTLRNFMTVLKLDDYMVISKYQSVSSRHLHDPQRKEKIVARISSNFFGTEFNCTLENKPYKNNNGNYPPPSKKQRIMTIQYQTNLLGLKGPRKMSAYIGEGSYQYSLSQIYQKEKNNKRTIKKFNNKMPTWCEQSNSYVLNFYGRASVASIKNFVMVGENEKESEYPRVLFGKFGKELFNLDVRHPFNILQALSLVISSFDKKFLCE